MENSTKITQGSIESMTIDFVRPYGRVDYADPMVCEHLVEA
ncbi:hypothetical protein GCM10025794_30070 [Massilia kyonggiensis]|jgi:hypothetical protein